ncbi:MAG: hypothetical protein QM765_27160 [Myxococcales bacterium]
MDEKSPSWSGSARTSTGGGAASSLADERPEAQVQRAVPQPQPCRECLLRSGWRVRLAVERNGLGEGLGVLGQEHRRREQARALRADRKRGARAAQGVDVEGGVGEELGRDRGARGERTGALAERASGSDGFWGRWRQAHGRLEKGARKIAHARAESEPKCGTCGATNPEVHDGGMRTDRKKTPSRRQPKKRRAAPVKVKALEQRVATLEATVKRLEGLLARPATVATVPYQPSDSDPAEEARRQRLWDDWNRSHNRLFRQSVIDHFKYMKHWEQSRGNRPDKKTDALVRDSERDAARCLNELWDRGYRLRLHGCKKVVRPAIAH